MGPQLLTRKDDLDLMLYKLSEKASKSSLTKTTCTTHRLHASIGLFHVTILELNRFAVAEWRRMYL